MRLWTTVWQTLYENQQLRSLNSLNSLKNPIYTYSLFTQEIADKVVEGTAWTRRIKRSNALMKVSWNRRFSPPRQRYADRK